MISGFNKKFFSNTYKLYKPINKIIFETKTNKSLIYFYKERFYTSFLKYSLSLIPIYFLSKYIKNNPFYKEYPISTPFIVLLQLYFIKRLFSTFIKRSNTISKIYLNKDGLSIEIIYQQSLLQKLRKIENNIFLYIPNLKYSLSKNKELNSFPEEYPFEIYYDNKLYWIKKLENSNKKFYLYKNYNYMNADILVSCFKGNPIDTNKYELKDENQELLNDNK